MNQKEQFNIIIDILLTSLIPMNSPSMNSQFSEAMKKVSFRLASYIILGLSFGIQAGPNTLESVGIECNVDEKKAIEPFHRVHFVKK